MAKNTKRRLANYISSEHHTLQQPIDQAGPDFSKNWLPIWCEGCNQQGYIFPESSEKPYFVVCKNCRFETSQVWCPKCQMGGAYVEDVVDRPSFWICSTCKSKYRLPADFYEQPIPLIPERELPADTRARIENHKKSGTAMSTRQKARAYLLWSLSVMGLFGPWGLLYMIVKRLPQSSQAIGVLIAFILGFLWLYVWRFLLQRLGKTMIDPAKQKLTGPH